LVDNYSVIARYYDSENADLTDDLNAYDLLADRFPGCVLDVGCGTGRVSLFFAQQGKQVTGIDPSPSMLEQAKQLAEEQGIDAGIITWLCERAESFLIDRRFSLAVFAFNGFLHLLEQDQQLAALRQIYAHLEPGGALVIDMSNPIGWWQTREGTQKELSVERTFTDLVTGQKVVQQSMVEVDRAKQILNITWVYDRYDPEDGLVRDVTPMQLRYVFAPEMVLLLKLAGYEKIELYGSYDFDEYDEASTNLFVVATTAET